jgi:hypothetical protein
LAQSVSVPCSQRTRQVFSGRIARAIRKSMIGLLSSSDMPLKRFSTPLMNT